MNSSRDEYLAQTTPASRVLSTNRPGICYVIGAVMAAGAIPIAVFGPWPASAVGAVMMVLLGTVAALPGWWSDHHRELANRTVAARLDQRDIAVEVYDAHEIVVKRSEQPRMIIQTNGQRLVQSTEFDLGDVTFAGWSGDGNWILLVLQDFY